MKEREEMFYQEYRPCNRQIHIKLSDEEFKNDPGQDGTNRI